MAMTANTQNSTARKSRYIPALDGLRTLAVLAVIAYHMGIPWAIGGLLGVTVFFVLSGYLITGLLIAEWERSRTINLPAFWMRRARRLLPAVLLAIFGTAALCTLFNHELLTKMRPDIIPSIFFYNNWWQIFRELSYFDALGSPSPLLAFWSLAIEEQFYLVWPVALLIALRLGAKRKHLAYACIVLICISALAMALIYSPDADPSRVYYGADTRAFSLLIGALLALVWPSSSLGMQGERAFGGRTLGERLHDPSELDTRTRLIFDGVGALALIGLLAMLAFTSGFTPFLYRGGMVLASVLTAIVIAVIAHPQSWLARIFALPPLVWMGKRSYGMYLWHYPILLLMIPRAQANDAPWWLLLLALVAIILVSAASYTFVEDPIRKRALGRMASEIRAGVYSIRDLVYSHIPQIASVGLVVVIGLGGIIFVPETSALEGGEAIRKAEENQADPAQATADTHKATQTYTVLLIGDSVSVRAIPYFEEQFPGGHIDSAVNRQLYVGQDVYREYSDAGLVGDVVVFSLGTNAAATDEQLDELIGAVGADKSIYLINTRSPQLWVSTTNQTIADAVARYENVYLIDWYSYSDGRSDVFDGDGTHLSEQGAQEFIALIRDTIAATTGLPVEPEVAPGDAAAEAGATEAAEPEAVTAAKAEATSAIEAAIGAISNLITNS